MPKGNHLSEESRQKIWSYYNLGKTSEECHQIIFFGSEKACTLKHIKKLYRLFSNNSKEDMMIDYLAKRNQPGPKILITMVDGMMTLSK